MRTPTRLPQHLAAALEVPDAAQEVEPGIWRSNNAVSVGPYDTIGTAYDFVGGLDLYHRLCWGVSTRAYRAFVESAIVTCAGGTLLDGGCGSMLFTARQHLATDRAACIGTDVSLKMLRLARARLRSRAQRRDIPLVHADVIRSPFRSEAFDVVLCMHLAHVLEDFYGLLAETRRILKPRGTLFLTSLVLVDSWRDTYLRMLSRRGIVAAPRRVNDLVRATQTVFNSKPVVYEKGSMLFIQVKKA